MPEINLTKMLTEILADPKVAKWIMSDKLTVYVNVSKRIINIVNN